MKILLLLVMLLASAQAEPADDFIKSLVKTKYVGVCRSGEIEETLHGKIKERYRRSARHVNEQDHLIVIHVDSMFHYRVTRFRIINESIFLRDEDKTKILIQEIKDFFDKERRKKPDDLE